MDLRYITFMKTKFLRFNRLPKLDTQAKTQEGPAPEPNLMTSLNSFHKQDSFRHTDIADALDAILRKNRSHPSE